MNQPAPAKANMAVIAIATLAALCVIGFMLYAFKKQEDRQAAITKWVDTYPVNAMVIAKHPNTRGLFNAHFMPYYDKAGQDGIERGQMELQQIFNVNYLTDYIWTVKEGAIKDYVDTQLALIDRLVKLQGNGPGLCEEYFANSALFEKVDATAGGRYFIEYMLASERLMLSAEDGVTYKITPQHHNYIPARNAASSAFWREFRALHPTLSQTQLQQAADLFDPLRSCAGYAEYLRALSKMDIGFQSLYWRSAMEKDRPRFEAMRRARGSE